ncbi:MAG: hypothetical protein DYH13_03155 [Alphaproteobacteria bacterium PRO2]|nr:hypothetical protein [Alphaproteobacteria bacterium PRO2]
MSDEIDIEGLIVEAATYLKKSKYAESIGAAFQAASAMAEDDPRHAKVRDILFNAAERSPNSLTGLKTLGRYYSLRGNYDDAVSSFQTGLRICKSDKGRAEFAIECASALMTSVNENRFRNEADKNRRLEQAEDYFHSALDYGANPPRIYSSLMYLCALKGDERKALFYAQKLVDAAGYGDDRALVARKFLQEAAGFDQSGGFRPPRPH